MKIFQTLVCFIGLLVLSSTSCLAAYPPGTWTRIIDGQDFTDNTLVLEGDAGSNTLVINSKFYSTQSISDSSTAEYDAISLRDVHNVYILNNEIFNIPGHGIMLRSTGSTDSVTIEGNKIYNIKYSGIIPKRNYDYPTVDHTNLRIANNTIYNVGSSDLDHGMYVMSKDTIIKNNTIFLSKGNGISIRSSGTISGNTIRDTQKSCIRYFSDHETGVSKTLLVENNVCYGVSGTDYPLISLLYSPDGRPEWMPDKYIIRFNTLVSTNGTTPGVQVQSSQFDSKNVQVYGNISINTQNTARAIMTQYIDYLSRNYISNQITGFKNDSLPYDLHILATSEAKGFAVGEEEYPATDRDGLARSALSLDAGAYVSPSFIPEKPGDANNDGQVNGIDFIIWKNNYILGESGYGSSFADFDNNGRTDGVDYIIWAINYNT